MGMGIWPLPRHPAVLVFVAAVLISIGRALGQWGRRRVTSARPARAAAEDLGDTIFVLIVLGPSARPIRLNALFAAATAPSRVFVGVYDDGAAAHFSPEHQRNVRHARYMRHTRAFHRPGARAWAAANLCRGERFTLLLSAHVQLVPGWDEALVSMLNAHPPKTVLTTAPPPRKALLSDAPSFLGLRGVHGARLELQPRLAAQPPREGELLPSLFWSPELSFCRSDTFERCPPASGMSARMEATVVGLIMWTHGYSFFAPTRLIAWGERELEEDTRPAGGEPPPRLGTARTLREYEAFSGVCFAKSEATRRARAGLSPRPKVAECVAKYGSLADARMAVRPNR